MGRLVKNGGSPDCSPDAPYLFNLDFWIGVRYQEAYGVDLTDVFVITSGITKWVKDAIVPNLKLRLEEWYGIR